MTTSKLSRRQFIPLTLGASALGMSAFGAEKHLPLCLHEDFEYQPVVDVPVRAGLGVVVIGASSGMGAELARQYAESGAYVVLAARRVDRLDAVAAEVAARGGTPNVVVTDVRNEADCAALVSQSIAWLASHGKAIDVCVLAAARVQASTFGPHLSMEVFRKAINAIESGAEYAFLSHLNKACWLAGPTRQDLGWFLVVLESLAGHQLVQQAEATVGQMLQAQGQLHQLAHMLSEDPGTELTAAAQLLTSVDLQVALMLAGLELVLPAEVITATRQTVQAHHDAYADGSYEQLLIALAGGGLSPSGIADDEDGLAPIMDCPPAGI